MDTWRRIGVVAMLCAANALAQAPNPAARGASATPRIAQRDRLAASVVETVVTGASPFSDSCGDHAGTLYVGAEVEPHIAVNPLNPNHMVGAWQQDRFSNGGARGQGYGVSFDAGTTWTRGALPVSVCAGGEFLRATDPWVAFAPDGTVHQISLGLSGETTTAIVASRSSDGGLTWSAPITVALATGTIGDDKETITADPLDSRFVYAVWDRLLGGGNSATFFARSTNGGASWEEPRSLYMPPQGGETIGNLIRVLPNGTLVNVFMQLSGAPVIFVMRSADRGVTWSAPIHVSSAGALGARDPETNTPIRDGSILPQMAVAPDGALYVVWQDARFTQQRDGVALSRSTDGGLTWSAPVRVNGDPNVMAFIPQVHVRNDGTIGVTYYDLRSNTADPATLPTDFWLARSTDGVNWTETRVSAAFDMATAPFANGLFVGDYTGLVSSGTTFIALYAKTTGVPANRNDVFAARIGAAVGTALEAKQVLAREAVADTYRAGAMPLADPGAAFWRAVSGNAQRALRRRDYLNVQR